MSTEIMLMDMLTLSADLFLLYVQSKASSDEF